MYETIFVMLCVIAVSFSLLRKYYSTASSKNVLFVCTKCSKAKNKAAKNTEIVDIEEAETSGCKMYRSIVDGFESDKNWKKDGDSFIRDNERLFVQGTQCLSNCAEANNIAFRGDKKYCYQFSRMECAGSDDVREFAYGWLLGDGFSKKKTRPDALKDTIVSRIPPCEIQGE